MTAKAGAQSIHLEYDLPHAPAKVWRALTDPKLVERWLMKTDLKAEKGHAFQFRAEPMPQWDGVVDCEVLEVEPQRRLKYTWKSHAPANLDTVVTWTLEPTAAGGTRLSLEHSGFLPSSPWAYKGAQQGWERNVKERLAAVLAEA